MHSLGLLCLHSSGLALRFRNTCLQHSFGQVLRDNRFREQLVGQEVTLEEKARPKAKAKVVAAPKWVPAAGSNTLQSAKLWLDKHKPPSSHIVCDDKNGRWLCSLLPFGRKSFSWTKRGQEKAVAAVFFQLWSWHKDLGGEEPPWSLDSLQAPP